MRRKAGYVQEMVDLLGLREIDAEARPTTGPHTAAELSRQAADDGVDIVISHGGDGTVNEVLQGLVGSDTLLAVWPGGTANVTARELDLPSPKESLAEVIGRGKTQRVAVGRAILQREGGETADERIVRYFLMMAGIGLDASVCRGTSQSLKRVSGKFAFYMSAAKHLVTPAVPSFAVATDGRRFEAAFAVVANGSTYGAPVCLTPAAELESPHFEVYALPPAALNVRYVLDFLRCLLSGAVHSRGELIKCTSVEASASRTVWVQLDGEVAGVLPATFEIVPDAVSVLIP